MPEVKQPKHKVHTRKTTVRKKRAFSGSRNCSVKETNQIFLSGNRVTPNKPKNAPGGSSKIGAIHSGLGFLMSLGLRILTPPTERTLSPPTVLPTSENQIQLERSIPLLNIHRASRVDEGARPKDAFTIQKQLPGSELFEIAVSTTAAHESKANPSETLPDSAGSSSVFGGSSNVRGNTENVRYTKWLGSSQFWSKWDTDTLNRTQRRAQLEKYCDSLEEKKHIPINCHAPGNTVGSPEDSIIQKEWRRIDAELRNAERFGNPVGEALSRLAQRRAFPCGSLSSKDASENPTEVRKCSNNVASWLNMVHQKFVSAKVVPPKYPASTLRPNAGNSSLLARVEKRQSPPDKASIVG